MTNRPTPRVLLAAALLMLSTAALAKGRLGFGVQVALDGGAAAKLKEVKISTVRPGGPAEKAGLRIGDTLTEFAGQRVAGSNGDELKQDLGSIRQGEHVKLLVLRAGKPIPVEIVAGPDQ